MKKTTNRTRGMILKMIETIWGNLRTQPARTAWAKAQVPRNKINDQLFRHWLISQKVPQDLARRAWEQGGKAEALAYIREQKDWIEYYRLEDEVNKAFKAEAKRQTA